jgi:flagellar basal-body rod protein FlgB
MFVVEHPGYEKELSHIHANIVDKVVLEMMLKMFDTPSARVLERAMEASMVRSDLLLNNIANVNTPNFKRSDIDFAAVFAETITQSDLPMVRTNPRHFGMSGVSPGNAGPRIITDTSTSDRDDGNNVDVEYEMAQISENSMYYQSLSALWKQEMTKLKSAIQGR